MLFICICQNFFVILQSITINTKTSMKKLTIFTVLLCAIVCALGLTSCADPVTKGYGLGISQFHSSGSSLIDLVKATEYLNSKGCPTEGEEHVLLITDSSLERCDKQAAAKFNTLVENLSRDEVAQLGLSADCSFTYSCARQENVGAERVEVGSWSYPGE